MGRQNMETDDTKDDGTSKAPSSLKELEDQKVAKKKAAQRKDDIAMVIGLLCILLITVTVVVVKVTMIDPKENTNIFTFKPLPQQILSNSKYTDVGYIPCNGYVPCMTDQMSPQMVEERMEGADPCHDYNEDGPGPEGCW